MPDPEIRQLHPDRFRGAALQADGFDQDVARLDVPVDHTRVMRRLQRVRRIGDNLQLEFQRNPVGPALRLTPTAQVLAADILLFEVIRRLVEIKVIELHDVGMIPDPLL